MPKYSNQKVKYNQLEQPKSGVPFPNISTPLSLFFLTFELSPFHLFFLNILFNVIIRT